MSFHIETLKGDKFNLKEDFNVRVIDFILDSPEIINRVVEMESGRKVSVESKYGLRTLNLVCRYHGMDTAIP